MILKKNNYDVFICDCNQGNGMTSLSISPVITSCQKGDIFTLHIGSNTASTFLTRGSRSCITVKKIK